MSRITRFVSRISIPNTSKLRTLSSMRFSTSISEGGTDQKAKQWADKLKSLHGDMSTEEVESLYNEWGDDYDLVLQKWGYQVPNITTKLFAKHFPGYQSKKIKIFDLGCGTGLVGQDIVVHAHDATLYGSDLSGAQFPMAEKKGYHDLKQWDMNQFPFPYEENSFDAMICAGTLTYATNPALLFDEWCRITKPGSIMICSHRDDLMKKDMKYFQFMEKEGKWERLELTQSFPYLPNNPNYGTDVQVQFYVARNVKKQKEKLTYVYSVC